MEVSEQVNDLATRTKHVAEWVKSGVSRSAYCERHGITVNQLTYWKTLGQNRNDRKRSVFVRAKVSSERASPHRDLPQVARLIVGSGSVLEISTAIDPVWLARVIAAVGAEQ